MITNADTETTLEVRGLSVDLVDGPPITEDVSFTVGRGEILALVGESGSGKTTTGLALLGYVRPGVEIREGSVRIQGQDVLEKSERERRALRGKLVSYVAQDPAVALNPAMRVGDHVAEMLRIHGRDADDAVLRDAFARVHLPTDPGFRRRYIHQLSGGQQQRLAIAIALVCRPPVVVMDEPTTGLDVVTQAHILDEIQRLKSELGLSVVYISHNLAVVGAIADRIAVMYAGRVVEQGPARTLLVQPRHPYTRGLLAAVPDHLTPRRLRGIPGIAVAPGERPRGCAFAPRCPQAVTACLRMPALEEIAPKHQVRCFEWRRTPALVLEEPLEPPRGREAEVPLLVVDSLYACHRSRHGEVVAADEVSLSVWPGESVAFVGESGSGKSTIARCIAGLHAPDGGHVILDGTPLAKRAKDRPRIARRRIQIVFQNPYDSLNPRQTVGSEIARPARVLRGLSRRDASAVAATLLERVRLPKAIAKRYPRELSGGERQRVAIARALAAEPDLLICDEITSALDVSVQAAVLELLATLRAELNVALLFISHDLGVVASVADRVLVLKSGVVRAEGEVNAVLAQPGDDYTHALIDAVPHLPSGGPDGTVASGEASRA